LQHPWISAPSEAAATDALKKGHGRVYLWAQAGKLPADSLLRACLNDYRYDRQCESARGEWLWGLLTTASYKCRLRDSVLAAVSGIEFSDAPYQLCQLAGLFALRGDDDFRRQLWRIVVDRPLKDCVGLGEDELIAVEGQQGFLAAVRRHGRDLTSREWEWFDRALGDAGQELLRDQQLLDLLDSESGADLEVRRFRDAWRDERERQAAATPIPYRERVSAPTVQEIIEAAEHGVPGCVSFRGWGRFAADDDLNRVYERLLASSGIEAIRRFLQVFAVRAFPHFDSRMLQLCLNDDANIRARATTAVANVRDPEIRRFALALYRDAAHQRAAISLLAANYEQGDEHLVLDALALPGDLDELHWTLMDLRDLVEKNPVAEYQQACEIVYEKSPCALCRHSVVKLWANRGRLPEGWLAECPHDVDKSIRELVTGLASESG
jgi:hypothetical protein